MSGPLDGYDGVLLDLDGTVLRGSETVPEAPDVVNELRQAGCAVQFITNNASRTPDEIADDLAALGIPTAGAQVVTSGQAAAAMLATRLSAEAAVLVVGTDALVAEVRSVGLRPVTAASEDPVAVVQGHSPDTGWIRLAEACLAIRGGALWVACNIDRTLPTERGLLPGNGAMVAALQAATDREPVVAGKPARALLDTARERAGAERPLVVGDRLETDIAGARGAELDSLLVLTGVSDAVALLAAPPEHRPTHVGADLRVLREPVGEARIQARPGWRVDVADGTLLIHSQGTVDDPLDALRTLCAVWWSEHSGRVDVCACDDTAVAVLDSVGLSEIRRPPR